MASGQGGQIQVSSLLLYLNSWTQNYFPYLSFISLRYCFTRRYITSISDRLWHMHALLSMLGKLELSRPLSSKVPWQLALAISWSCIYVKAPRLILLHVWVAHTIKINRSALHQLCSIQGCYGFLKYHIPFITTFTESTKTQSNKCTFQGLSPSTTICTIGRPRSRSTNNNWDLPWKSKSKTICLEVRIYSLSYQA